MLTRDERLEASAIESLRAGFNDYLPKTVSRLKTLRENGRQPDRSKPRAQAQELDRDAAPGIAGAPERGRLPGHDPRNNAVCEFRLLHDIRNQFLEGGPWLEPARLAGRSRRPNAPVPRTETLRLSSRAWN